MDQNEFAYAYSMYVSNYINVVNEGIQLNKHIMDSSCFGGSHFPTTTPSSEAVVGPSPPRVKVFPCKYCPRKFINPRALGGHQNAHKKERTTTKGLTSSPSEKADVSDREPPASSGGRPVSFKKRGKQIPMMMQVNQDIINMDPSLIESNSSTTPYYNFPDRQLELTPTSSHHQLIHHYNQDQDMASIDHCTLDLDLRL